MGKEQDEKEEGRLSGARRREAEKRKAVDGAQQGVNPNGESAICFVCLTPSSLPHIHHVNIPTAWPSG